MVIKFLAMQISWKGGATVVLSYEGMEDVTYTVVASSDKELKFLLTTW